MKIKLKWILCLLNIPRACIVYMLSWGIEKVCMDYDRWSAMWNRNLPKTKSAFMRFNYLLLFYREFRSVVQARLKEKSYIRYAAARILYKPVVNLEILSSKIEGGLFVEHGFSSIICPKHIGKNCWINQQVTVGHTSIDDCPTIGDNVRICTGAIVIGNVHIGDNSTIGAGAVVVKDVPANAVVVGVPAKVVKYKTTD